MTRYKPGDLVLVRFPFTDFSTLKKRPALVLSSPGFTAQQGDVVVMAMTSQPQRDAGLRLAEWKAAGAGDRLPAPSDGPRAGKGKLARLGLGLHVLSART